MDRGVGAAVRSLRESGRKDLAIQALAGSETVGDLAARHGVSRKFVYQQTHKARAALDEAFSSATPDEAVLFELAVTKTWLRQVIVGLTLICRGSYRGVVEFLRDLLGLPVSLGHVHDVLQAATRQASVVNGEPDLSGIRVGLHDEIFQGATPVLAGVDAQSTYCYLLAAEQHRDADTWGVHLLDAAERGLRAGQQAAWGDTPCHGDVFHIQRQCGGLANTLMSGLCRGVCRWPSWVCACVPGTNLSGVLVAHRVFRYRLDCRALPRAPRRGARRCRPGPAAPANGIPTPSL